MINGHNAQLQRVQNLFHSVQLNVNNPHFLIMQGRITKVAGRHATKKWDVRLAFAGRAVLTVPSWRRGVRTSQVLNMKPIEILGMIEEAAGTRMFETKKRKAVETIEKKETKVRPHLSIPRPLSFFIAASLPVSTCLR